MRKEINQKKKKRLIYRTKKLWSRINVNLPLVSYFYTYVKPQLEDENFVSLLLEYF